MGALVAAPHCPHSVIIDCTASEAVADRYAGWLSQGINVVSANNRCLSGPFDRCAAP